MYKRKNNYKVIKTIQFCKCVFVQPEERNLPKAWPVKLMGLVYLY